MHVVFIPYGERDLVQIGLRDMASQKFYIPYKKGKETKQVLVGCQLRILPFGFYEYIFPREYRDQILATLHLDENRYKIKKIYLSAIRKVLGIKPIPKEFNKKSKFPWYLEHTNVITIGIREDEDLLDKFGDQKGWTHEAL